MASIEKKTEQKAPDQLSGSDVEINGHINAGALLRKIDLKLLPAVGILYLLSFLDRSNGKSVFKRSLYHCLLIEYSRQRPSGWPYHRPSHEYDIIHPDTFFH